MPCSRTSPTSTPTTACPGGWVGLLRAAGRKMAPRPCRRCVASHCAGGLWANRLAAQAVEPRILNAAPLVTSRPAATSLPDSGDARQSRRQVIGPSYQLADRKTPCSARSTCSSTQIRADRGSPGDPAQRAGVVDYLDIGLTIRNVYNADGRWFVVARTKLYGSYPAPRWAWDDHRRHRLRRHAPRAKINSWLWLGLLAMC